MTTSDCWVIWDNRLGMLEVTTKECHGLHRYDCVLLEGDTNHKTHWDEPWHLSIVGFTSRPMRFMSRVWSTSTRCKWRKSLCIWASQRIWSSSRMISRATRIYFSRRTCSKVWSSSTSRWLQQSCTRVPTIPGGMVGRVIEFEYGDDWLDKTDKNSQCLET